MTPQRAAEIACRRCRDRERLGEAFEAMLAFDERIRPATDENADAWIALVLRNNAVNAARRAAARGRGRTRTLGDWTIPVRDRGLDLVEARDELRAFLDAAMPATQRLLRAYAHTATRGEAAMRCGRSPNGAAQAMTRSLHHERTVRADAHRRRFFDTTREGMDARRDC